MILTGPKIEECMKNCTIHIDPLGDNLVGPNSVDLRLHAEMKVYERERHPAVGGVCFNKPHEFEPLNMKEDHPTRDICMSTAGYVLMPGILYLGRTMETIGSDHFVPMVEGRSSCGRLGLQVHMTAGCCDTGFKGTITLEMTVVHPLKIYPAQAICQVFFLRPEGAIRLYKGRYQGHKDATASRMHHKRDGAGR